MTREELLKIAKPVLFNTEMVQAILEGRKTVTRRCVKYKYSNTEMKMHTDKYGTRLIEIQKNVEGETHGRYPDGRTWQKLLPYIEKNPPFKKGDYLYVRETWQYLYELDGNEQIIEGTDRYYYKATDTIPYDTYVDSMGITHETVPWKPSIHMPKEAARLFLKVTDVRVERLQDMEEEDAIKEGIHPKMCPNCSGLDCDLCSESEYTVMDEFMYLWNSTIKKAGLDKYGWDANPWVWVIEFERVDV